MPNGFGVGLRVAAIPVAGVEALSPEGGRTPPGGGGAPPGGGTTAEGGLGGIGLIGLLLLVLGVGGAVLVSNPDDEQAQVQQQVSQNGSEMNRVRLGSFVAE